MGVETSLFEVGFLRYGHMHFGEWRPPQQTTRRIRASSAKEALKLARRRYPGEGYKVVGSR
jgi:hypothetical protein